MVARKAPHSPSRLNKGNVKRMVLLFLLSPGCDRNKSAISTSSATTARTNSGAIRPQSAADTVYVNDIETLPGHPSASVPERLQGFPLSNYDNTLTLIRRSQRFVVYSLLMAPSKR